MPAPEGSGNNFATGIGAPVRRLLQRYFKSKTAKAPCQCGAVIIYGRGADLGDFSIYANTLAKELKSTYGERIVSANIENKNKWVEYLATTTFSFQIAELHIFSHSIGGGLFLGYHGTEGQVSRTAAGQKAAREGRNITYEEVRDAEVGGLLTDDLIKPAFTKVQGDIKAKFCDCGPAGTPFGKLWGCNAGVADWYYDDDNDGDGVQDGYYWRALNEKNAPKPAVAQALADYLRIPVWGASSGSHAEVKENGKWITSQQYKDAHGKWPSGSLPYRLNPDKGTYSKYSPK